MMRAIHVCRVSLHLFLLTLCVPSSDEKKLVQDDTQYFTNWSYCDNKTDYYKINYFIVDPPVPVKNGRRTNITANIDIYKQENLHIVHIFTAVEESVGNEMLNVTIMDDNFNACDLAADILHQPCPIPPGNYNVSGIFDTFNLFPVGKYIGKVTVFTDQGKEIVCINIKFSIIP